MASCIVCHYNDQTMLGMVLLAWWPSYVQDTYSAIICWSIDCLAYCHTCATQQATIAPTYVCTYIHTYCMSKVYGHGAEEQCAKHAQLGVTSEPHMSIRTPKATQVSGYTKSVRRSGNSYRHEHMHGIIVYNIHQKEFQLMMVCV